MKTNRRLRLEVEYTREGLSRVRLPTDAPQIRPPGVQLVSETNRRAPVTLDAHELVPLWHFLAAHCLPQMNAILQRTRIVPTYHWTPEHLLSVIAPVFSRSSRAELETLIGAVTRDHRLTTQTLPYRKLAQLRRAGVLVSTNRGIYARLIAFTSQTRLRPIRIGGTRGTT